MQRICKVHGLTEFYKRTDQPGYRCKLCRSDAIGRKRTKLRDRLIEYKGGQCVRCGYSTCNDVLQFHHVDPQTKEFTLAKNNLCWSFDKLLKEADKCILLCANCHAEHHAGIW